MYKFYVKVMCSIFVIKFIQIIEYETIRQSSKEDIPLKSINLNCYTKQSYVCARYYLKKNYEIIILK